MTSEGRHTCYIEMSLSQKAFKREHIVWCPFRVTEQAVWRCLQQAGLLDQDSGQSALGTETTVSHRCTMQSVAVVMWLCNHSTITLLAY